MTVQLGKVQHGLRYFCVSSLLLLLLSASSSPHSWTSPASSMLPPLTSVSLLPRIDLRFADHVAVRLISDFLDASLHVTASRALATHNATLLQRVLMRETSGQSALEQQHWVWTALRDQLTLSDVRRPPVEVLACLMRFVHPNRPLTSAVVSAIDTGDLTVVQCLYSTSRAASRMQPVVDDDAVLRHAAITGRADVVAWLLDQRSSTAPAAKPLAKSKPKRFELGPAGAKAFSATELTEDKWRIVEMLAVRLGMMPHRSVPLLAAKSGRLSTLQVLKSHSSALSVPSTITTASANAAAAAGHWAIVSWLGVSLTDDAFDDACMSDNMEILQRLHAEYGRRVSPAGALRAADNGHTAVLQWLKTTFPQEPFWTDLPGFITPAFHAATDNAHLQVLEWLYEMLLVPLLPSLPEPERAKRLIDTIHVYTTIRHNNLAVLQFLHTHELVCWDDWESHNAAYYANLETLQWMDAQGLLREPGNELMCVVYAGRTECVQWILDHRPRGNNTSIIEYAALIGRLDLLQVLQRLGDTLVGSPRSIDYTASKGHIEVLQFLFDHRRRDGATHAAIHSACLGGHIDTVKFLTEHEAEIPGVGCTTMAMDAAASKGHLDIVKYLHTHRTEGCTVFAMDSAAANGDLATVQFLHEHRREGCSVAAFEGAACNGHFEVVKFLVEHYPQTVSSTMVKRVKAKGEVEIANWLEESGLQNDEGSTATASPDLQLQMASLLPPAPPVVAGLV